MHGSTDLAGYLAVGRQCWRDLAQLAANVGRTVDDLTSILDFGCGPGRVIAQISTATRDGRPRQICGVDVDAAAIRWCRRHLPGRQFCVGSAQPPLEFPAGSFDFIFAISVFSHLNEQMQSAWLAELRRLLRPGGLLIASVHGEYHRSITKRRFDMARGFVFTELHKGRLKKDGLPDFYQDAQHTRAYVEREWSRHFAILDYVERGIAAHQDAVVMTTL